MQKAIIGKKVGMTQIFDEKGNVIPVTVVEAGPCVVAQIKTVENDGYEAVQMGFGDIKLKVQTKDSVRKNSKTTLSILQSLFSVTSRKQMLLRKALSVNSE